MTTHPTAQDLELFVMGAFEGPTAEIETHLADCKTCSATIQREARLELDLIQLAGSTHTCPSCRRSAASARCESCGCALVAGDYRVLEVVVQNAHGRLYLAEDAKGQRVALKELAFVQAPGADAVAAFEREAKFLRALTHPNIPRFVASFEEGEGVHTRLFLAQEYIEGESLQARLADHWFDEDEVLEIARRTLEVLVYLQELSPVVIHGDIKPANLVRRRDGTIALVDFGAARGFGGTITSVVGTFGYMPIEQLAGIVDATTDLYALGTTLLHLLTRQEPWRLAQTRAAVNVSAPLRAFLDKLVAPDPRDRFPSAVAALAALERPDELVVRRPASRSWRRPMLAAAAVFAVVASGAGVYTLARSSSAPAPEVPTPAQPLPTAPREPTLTSRSFATIKFRLGGDGTAKLFVDGNPIATVKDGTEVAIGPGVRHVKLVGNNGAECDDERVTLTAGSTTTLECLSLSRGSAVESVP